jgi:hypothetical protein
MLEHYADRITINDEISTEKLYDVMEGTILGKLPSTMPKIIKDDGKLLASGVKGKNVNIYDKDRKIFTNDLWILHDVDKTNSSNVLVTKKENGGGGGGGGEDEKRVYSVPYAYVRLSPFPPQTVCRRASGKDCRPEPYSFKQGSCPEGIIQMVSPYGEQSAYDARFYPCCENYSHDYIIDWLLDGFTKNERKLYLIPDEVRTDSNIDKVIDNFTGSLDPILMNTDDILIKNKGITKKEHKYIFAKYVKLDKKLENKEAPKQYIVKSNGREISVNGTDLHPMYREVRNFRGLNTEMPDILDQKLFLKEFIEQEYPEHKTFLKVGYNVVFNTEDMYNRYTILNRKNLTNLCSEQYFVDIIPRSSVYAEIKVFEGNCYMIDIYGRGYIIKKLPAASFKDIIIRGYLNYQYSIPSQKIEHKDIVYHPQLMSVATKNSYFYTSSLELHKYSSIFDELGLKIRQLAQSPNKIAKYIKSEYYNLVNSDVVIYNSRISYHLQRIPIRKVALKVLDIDNEYMLLLGFKDGTYFIKDYRKSDDISPHIP